MEGGWFTHSIILWDAGLDAFVTTRWPVEDKDGIPTSTSPLLTNSGPLVTVATN